MPSKRRQPVPAWVAQESAQVCPASCHGLAVLDQDTLQTADQQAHACVTIDRAWRLLSAEVLLVYEPASPSSTSEPMQGLHASVWPKGALATSN